MLDINNLITDNLDIWSSTKKNKKTVGRGSSAKIELYGVKKLRELILELAMRGLLVPQDPMNSPASDTIKLVSEFRDSLVKQKKIKKAKAPAKIIEKEGLPNLPNGWIWSCINEIAELSPRNVLDDNLEVSFISMPSISTNYDGSHSQESRRWRDVKKGYTHFAEGDIALAKITPCFENSKAAIFRDLTNNYGAGTTELHIARLFGDFTNEKFVLLYLKSPQFLKVGETKMTGSAGQKRVPKDFFALNPLPLPPIEEQNRIVAKVDELMALCDQLEQQQEDSISAHQTLVKTLLDALVDSASHSQTTEGKTKFEQAWERIADHFDTLFITEDSIDQLKQTILQLAVMGKLVPQDPNDEPASQLLKKITNEKILLIKEKKIKKLKSVLPLTNEEIPVSLPQNWQTVRFSELVQEVATGPFGTMINKNEYINSGIPLINPSHMINGKIVEDTSISVSRQKAESLSSYTLREGDVVMARRGEMGRCALVTNRENGWLCGTGSFVLRFHQEVNREFILILFKAKSVVNYLGGESVGATMTNLNHGILNKMPLNLPPVAEQHLIVTKAKELLEICEKLETILQTVSVTQLKLSVSIAKQALN
jgi:type I restriction enzyme S subunit